MTKKKVISIISNKTPIQKIIRITEYRDCWEVIGEVGGDVLTYRVYGNGEITEK